MVPATIKREKKLKDGGTVRLIIDQHRNHVEAVDSVGSVKDKLA
jgi:hypothetical protein